MCDDLEELIRVVGPDTKSTSEGIRKSVEKTISELGFIPDLLYVSTPIY